MWNKSRYILGIATILISTGCGSTKVSSRPVKSPDRYPAMRAPIRVIGGSITYTDIRLTAWAGMPCLPGSGGYGSCYSEATNSTSYGITLQNHGGSTDFPPTNQPFEIDFQTNPQRAGMRVATSICSNLDATTHQCTLSPATATSTVYAVPATTNDGFVFQGASILYQTNACSGNPSCDQIATIRLRIGRTTDTRPQVCNDGTPGGVGKCNAGIDPQ